MILGQLGWFVREKLSGVDPRRVPAAVDALFRTDLDLKSSGGDPRVLLERLVVELCRR
jgi:DNA polymerase III delta subunit